MTCHKHPHEYIIRKILGCCFICYLSFVAVPFACIRTRHSQFNIDFRIHLMPFVETYKPPRVRNVNMDRMYIFIWEMVYHVVIILKDKPLYILLHSILFGYYWLNMNIDCDDLQFIFLPFACHIYNHLNVTWIGHKMLKQASNRLCCTIKIDVCLLWIEFIFKLL